MGRLIELDWFLERVGKVVIRRVNTCTISGCNTGDYSFEVKITDENHARLLHGVHVELGSEFLDAVEQKQKQTN